MMSMRILCLLLLADVMIATRAAANDCMSRVDVTRDLVRTSHDYTGYPGAAGVPPFLEAVQTEYRGTVVMVEKGHRWTAFVPQENEDAVGTFVSKGSDVFIFTMFGTEGPGSSWTLFHSSDGFTTGHCTNIPFPAALNRPEWRSESLELIDFNIAPDGKGAVVGSSPVEGTGSTRTWWFKYTTNDGGRTWLKPRWLRSKPVKLTGSVTQIAVGHLPTLYRNLQSSVLSAKPVVDRYTRARRR